MKLSVKNPKGWILYWTLIFACLTGIFMHLVFIAEKKDGALLSWIRVPKISAAIVSSGSMSPVLEVGDLVMIAESAHYQTGDIVEIVDRQQVHVLHRLIIYEPYADIALTQGDANSAADEPVRCSSIKGKLLVTLPGVGTVIDWFRSTTGHWVLTATAFLLFLSVLWSFLRKKSCLKNKNHPADDTSVYLEKGETCGKKMRTRGTGLIVTVTLALLLLTLTFFSCTQIFSLFRSSVSGTFSLQAGSDSTETDTSGIDEVYVWLE